MRTGRHQWVGAVLATCLIGLAGPARAFQQTEFRAANGTTYQLLRGIGFSSGVERARITTLAGSSTGIGGCNLTMTGSSASAVAGVLPPGQTLHAFTSILRTTVLAPNDVNAVSFDPAGGGRLTLGSGAGALNVCHNSANCPGGMSVLLVGLANSDAAVPAACIANGLQASCEPGNMRNAIAFGLPASGSPPVCTTPANVTVNRSVCASEPADGFSLPQSAAIVFVYNTSLAGLGFGIGAGGFGIDTNASPCTDSGVINAIGRLDSDPGAGPGPPSRPAPALAPLALAVLAAALGLWGVRRLRRAA